MVRIILALCAFSLFAGLSATAQASDWPESVWEKAKQRKAARKQKARVRARHHRHKRRAAANRIDTSRFKTGSIPRNKVAQPQKCMPGVSVVGDQSTTTNGAKAQAEKAWQQQVRFLNGELYADPRNASVISYRCVDSSIRNIANRATEAIGINSQFKRCSMTAVPCRAPTVREDGTQ